jgi:hypothetical protein
MSWAICFCLSILITGIKTFSISPIRQCCMILPPASLSLTMVGVDTDHGGRCSLIYIVVDDAALQKLIHKTPSTAEGLLNLMY